jgi:hypothetical protein
MAKVFLMAIRKSIPTGEIFDGSCGWIFFFQIGTIVFVVVDAVMSCAARNAIICEIESRPNIPTSSSTPQNFFDFFDLTVVHVLLEETWNCLLIHIMSIEMSKGMAQRSGNVSFSVWKL